MPPRLVVHSVAVPGTAREEAWTDLLKRGALCRRVLAIDDFALHGVTEVGRLFRCRERTCDDLARVIDANAEATLGRLLRSGSRLPRRGVPGAPAHLTLPNQLDVPSRRSP